MARRSKNKFNDSGLFVDLGQTLVSFGINNSEEAEVYMDTSTDHLHHHLGMTLREARKIYRMFGRAIDLETRYKADLARINKKAKKK